MGIRTYFYLLFFLFISVKAFSEDAATPPVVVRVEKHIDHTSVTDAPKILITQKQLSLTGTTSLAQALQSLGGVQLQDMSGNGSQVLLSLRGFGSNATSNTLLLVNGIPITNPDIAGPDLNAIPIQEISSIEIIAGSESVLYGDQAVGGVINILTQPTTNEKVVASCTTGSYDQVGCYLTWNNPKHWLNYSITAGRTRTTNYREQNDYDQSLLSGRFDYSYATGNLNFNYKIAGESMQYPGALTAAQVRQNRRQSTNNTDFFTDSNNFFHIRQRQILNENWYTQLDLSRRGMQGHGVLSSPFQQTRNVYFFKPQLKGEYKDTVIETGLDTDVDYYHLGTNFSVTNNKQQKYSIFILTNSLLTPALALSLGARGALQDSHLESFSGNNETLNRAFATTIGLTYALTEKINTYLRRAGSYRFPKADEMAASNTNLRAQRGVAYETGVEWEKENSSAKMGVYQLNLRDEIAFDPTQTPEAPFGSNRNLSPTVRRGITLSGKKQVTDNLSLNGQYNYVDAEFRSGTNAGNRIPLVSDSIFRAGLDYHLTDNWNIYLEALFTGNQYAANDDANVAGLMGGYTIFNINLRYVYNNLTASFRVNNIFNKYYYFYTDYEPSIQTEFFYPAPGRNVVLVINYLFT